MENTLLAFRSWLRLLFSSNDKKLHELFFNRLSKGWLCENKPINDSCVCNWGTPWDYWVYVKDADGEFN